MVVLSALALILWLFIVPMGMGLLVQRILPTTKKTIGINFLCGYILSFAVFEVICFTWYFPEMSVPGRKL